MVLDAAGGVVVLGLAAMSDGGEATWPLATGVWVGGGGRRPDSLPPNVVCTNCEGFLNIFVK